MLTELTLRSKASWATDEAFLADARSELVFDPEKYQPDFCAYVLEEEGVALGFCGLARVDKETMQLHDLWIESAHIGKGQGTRLWNYAVNVARQMGSVRIVLTADPNAEGFYLRRGWARCGSARRHLRFEPQGSANHGVPAEKSW